MEVESIEDCLADVPSLFEDPSPAQASYDNGAQASATPSPIFTPPANWYSEFCSPHNIEAPPGCTASTYNSPFAAKGPEVHTSDVSDHQTSLMRPTIGISVAGNSTVRSQSTGHKRGQGASFALPLPTRTKSLCPYLPSQDSGSRCESGSPSVATMYNHQPRGFEVTYAFGPADADSTIVLPSPYLVPYTDSDIIFAPPFPESQSQIIGEIPTRTHPHIPSQASRFTAIPPIQATGSQALKRPTRHMPSLPSSNDLGIVNISGFEIPSRSKITSPYPRRPSDHASFLPYNLH